MRRSLLIYDGSRRVFRRVAARVTDRLGDVRPVRWRADPVQAFLEAQFGRRPFVVVLVEGETVHVGDAAVGRVLRRGGLGSGLSSIAERAYPAVSDPLGRVLHGRAPADINGSFPLDTAAGSHLEPLRR